MRPFTHNLHMPIGPVMLFGNLSKKSKDLILTKQTHSYSFILDEKIQVVVLQGFYNNEKLGIYPKTLFFLKLPRKFYQKTHIEYWKKRSGKWKNKKNLLLFKEIIHQFLDLMVLGIDDIFGFRLEESIYLKLSLEQERLAIDYIKNFSPSDYFIKNCFPNFFEKFLIWKKTHPFCLKILDTQVVENLKDYRYLLEFYEAFQKPFCDFTYLVKRRKRIVGFRGY